MREKSSLRVHYAAITPSTKQGNYRKSCKNENHSRAITTDAKNRDGNELACYISPIGRPHQGGPSYVEGRVDFMRRNSICSSSSRNGQQPDSDGKCVWIRRVNEILDRDLSSPLTTNPSKNDEHTNTVSRNDKRRTRRHTLQGPHPFVNVELQKKKGKSSSKCPRMVASLDDDGSSDGDGSHPTSECDGSSSRNDSLNLKSKQPITSNRVPTEKGRGEGEAKALMMERPMFKASTKQPSKKPPKRQELRGRRRASTSDAPVAWICF
mmetsp:Transcript_28319/g.59821  ORF Transcript_28319/g.59821 Transcript_28319/m.59821 type:complete len:266 (+) Transcript_28319:63-860(+)|eukprot:CAMPEP_0183735336 /NCGR_PEP_ID=MMETSP0737-20130205/46344_1 /TAXON_ID=385413 /ORGANISM="Thalassiosira miniscula, Strain CCMP1093" /LENGTH=265 /DNA_ID=CAMNT_0025969051 /DNA_START=26 /DNA_END=823 /DNA_ORIENTATION=-